MNKIALKIINELDLKPHPEGGYYVQSFKSKTLVNAVDIERYRGKHRTAGTAIYYLLPGEEFSAWHALFSDEIWHYYKGCTVKIYELDPDGNLVTHLLGDPEYSKNAKFQVHIPSSHWFAAENTDSSSFSLVGCTVSPGFEYDDFVLADKKSLSTQFPQHQDIINRLTRE